LAYQDKFFVNNPLDVKENDEHALEFVLHLSRFFGLSENGHFHWEEFCIVSVITVHPALVTSDNARQEGLRLPQNLVQACCSFVRSITK
jgi:hypothetical protein